MRLVSMPWIWLSVIVFATADVERCESAVEGAKPVMFSMGTAAELSRVIRSSAS